MSDHIVPQISITERDPIIGWEALDTKRPSNEEADRKLAIQLSRQIIERDGQVGFLAWYRIYIVGSGASYGEIARRAAIELEHPSQCYCREYPDGRVDTCELCRTIAQVKAEMEQSND